MPAQILRKLGVRKVRLISGNPSKAAALRLMCIATTLDSQLDVSLLSQEARHEIEAKVRRGYTYNLPELASLANSAMAGTDGDGD